MHVHVDIAGIDSQANDRQRESSGRQPVSVRLLDRVGEPAVVHRSAVDKQPHPVAVATTVLSSAGEAIETQLVVIHLLELERALSQTRAEHAGERVAQQCPLSASGVMVGRFVRLMIEHFAFVDPQSN